MWLCRLWKNGLDSWATCRGSSRALQVRRARTVKGTLVEYTNIQTPRYLWILPVCCVLKISVCCGSDLESWMDLCNGLDFEIHPDSFGLIQTIDTVRKRLKLDELCLARDYECGIWWVQGRNFYRSWCLFRTAKTLSSKLTIDLKGRKSS